MLKTVLLHPLPIILLGLLCAAAAVAYVQLRPSHYTAPAVLNITNLRLTSSDQNTFYTEALYDPSFLETQIQIIASEPIARSVIESEGLVQAAQGDEQKALKNFRSRLSVLRVGQSNLAQVSFVDSNPDKAASVANAVANAYIQKLRSDREESVRTASSWLRERLRGVGAQAQIVSEATPPVDKSDPRGILIIGAAGAIGGTMGLLLAFLLGFLDDRIRTSEQARRATGVECIGMIPYLRAKRAKSKQPKPESGQFSFAEAPAILSIVEREPHASLWQALRSAGAATPRTPTKPQRIGVTSAFEGEGKTTVAANLALVAAGSGRRVLLVDAQIYGAALSKMLAPGAATGVLDLLSTDASLTSHILNDPRSGVDFLPYGGNIAGTKDSGGPLLWSSQMKKLFDQADEYDLIVFDMPPLVATGDIRAAAQHLDNVLLVVRWKKVPAAKLQAALSLVAPIREKLVGTLLNRTRHSLIDRWFSAEAVVMAKQAKLPGKLA
jgi:Mrp family chromosome partitioning ATPase